VEIREFVYSERREVVRHWQIRDVTIPNKTTKTLWIRISPNGCLINERQRPVASGDHVAELYKITIGLF